MGAARELDGDVLGTDADRGLAVNEVAVKLRCVAVLESTPVSESDFEMLLDDGDELEMLEDLEFYSWLDLAGPSAGDDVG